MYRNTAFSGNIAIANSNQSNSKPTQDSDNDITELLRQKREQLDREVAVFRALKDKEFREYERMLRKQRSKRKKDGSNDVSASTLADRKPGALNLLGGARDQVFTNGSTSKSKPPPNDVGTRKKTKTVPSSQPSLSLDRLNITGQSTPPRSLRDISPSNVNLMRQVSRSPTNIDGLSLTPPRNRPSNPATPPSSSTERDDCFAGVFTPAYLPLLDSKKKLKTAEPTVAEDLQSSKKGSFSLPKGSVDDSSLSPLSRTERAATEPTIASMSLPSALRTTSGTTIRRRKHVTFQLADNAIVEPSSSYEELPSPDPRQEGPEEMDGIADMIANGGEEDDDEEEDVRSHPFWSRELRSPTIKGRERLGSEDSSVTITDFADGIAEAEDGGSGVGFFELDEELGSPRTGEPRPFEEDDNDQATGGDLEETEKDEDDLEVVLKQTYEYGGSVPINIVRPSSSWVGSFGH